VLPEYALESSPWKKSALRRETDIGAAAAPVVDVLQLPKQNNCKTNFRRKKNPEFSGFRHSRHSFQVEREKKEKNRKEASNSPESRAHNLRTVRIHIHVKFSPIILKAHFFQIFLINQF
jgi:hypothetical protein